MTTAIATKTRRLREASDIASAAVDAEAGIIRGVKVLGMQSTNGRVYPRDVIAKALPLYEGARVNVNHPGPAQRAEARGVQDMLGQLVNVRQDADGSAYGDLEYLRSHPVAAVLAEAAQRMPAKLGLSHVVEARVKADGNLQIVEGIERVVSVDLVSEPATTRGLFESEGYMDGMAAPVSSDPGAAVSDGFRSAILAVLDGEGDKKSKLAKIKALLDAEEKAIAAMSKGEASSEEPPADSVAGAPAAESKQPTAAEVLAENKRLKAELSAQRLLTEAGVTNATAVQVKALTVLESEDDRKALIATWKQTSGAKPRSTLPAATKPGDSSFEDVRKAVFGS